MTSLFKASLPLETRQNICKTVLRRYPDRVPVVVERGMGSHVPEIPRKKYLAPVDASVAKFSLEIRKYIQLQQNETLCLLIDNNGDRRAPNGAMLMGQVYEQYKDEDGFLYITYTGETVYGFEELE